MHTWVKDYFECDTYQQAPLALLSPLSTLFRGGSTACAFLDTGSCMPLGLGPTSATASAVPVIHVHIAVICAAAVHDVSIQEE